MSGQQQNLGDREVPQKKFPPKWLDNTPIDGKTLFLKEQLRSNQKVGRVSKRLKKELVIEYGEVLFLEQQQKLRVLTYVSLLMKG